MPSDKKFTTGSWHHVVGVIDTVNDFRAIYIDGDLVASDNSAIPPLQTNSESLYIGSRMGLWPTDGRIDEVVIYNKALSSSEIMARYSSEETCSGTGSP